MTQPTQPVLSTNNYAFIDGQNLHAGVESLGWKLDHKKFRDYLKTKFNVTKAYFFLGFLEEQQPLYSALQEAGFILHFKPVVRNEDIAIKGNVDADLVLQAMIDFERYDQAVIVSGDGDFSGLIRHLASTKKLRHVIIPNRHSYSSLFKRLDEYGDEYFTYMNDLRNELAYHDNRHRFQRPKKSGEAPTQN